MVRCVKAEDWLLHLVKTQSEETETDKLAKRGDPGGTGRYQKLSTLEGTLVRRWTAIAAALRAGCQEDWLGRGWLTPLMKMWERDDESI